jgi:hypothetical protein
MTKPPNNSIPSLGHPSPAERGPPGRRARAPDGDRSRLARGRQAAARALGDGEAKRPSQEAGQWRSQAAIAGGGLRRSQAAVTGGGLRRSQAGVAKANRHREAERASRAGARKLRQQGRPAPGLGVPGAGRDGSAGCAVQVQAGCRCLVSVWRLTPTELLARAFGFTASPHRVLRHPPDAPHRVEFARRLRALQSAGEIPALRAQSVHRQPALPADLTLAQDPSSPVS